MFMQAQPFFFMMIRHGSLQQISLARDIIMAGFLYKLSISMYTPVKIRITYVKI